MRQPGWFLLRLLHCGWVQPRTIPLPIFSWAYIPDRWAGLLACFGYLVIRKTISWRPTAAFLGTAVLAAFCIPRITTGRFQSVLYELTSGLLLFGAVFLVNDPATSPKSQMTRTIYAAIAGVVVMIFRYLGAYEEGLVFAILLMNAFSLFIDMCYEKIRHRERRALYAEQQTETV